jgi:hypothetical protein
MTFVNEVGTEFYHVKYHWNMLVSLLYALLIQYIITDNTNPNLRAGRSSVRSSHPCMVKNFLCYISFIQLLGSTQSPTHLAKVTSPWGQTAGSEANPFLPPNAEVKQTSIYTSAYPYVFVLQCLTSKAQERLYIFTLIECSPAATNM